MGPRINEKIIAKTVQVISDDGQNLGVMDTRDAVNINTNKKNALMKHARNKK